MDELSINGRQYKTKYKTPLILFLAPAYAETAEVYRKPGEAGDQPQFPQVHHFAFGLVAVAGAWASSRRNLV